LFEITYPLACCEAREVSERNKTKKIYGNDN